MKEKITKNGIDYVLVGDYYMLDLMFLENVLMDNTNADRENSWN